MFKKSNLFVSKYPLNFKISFNLWYLDFWIKYSQYMAMCQFSILKYDKVELDYDIEY